MDPLDPLSLQEISARTLGHYEAQAEAFWRGTRDHDVQQNLQALLDALVGPGPHRILDFGCGPGRDLLSLKKQHGCRVVGLDGCTAFVEHARKLTGAEVWQQDFLKLNLPTDEFDGVALARFNAAQGLLVLDNPGAFVRLRSFTNIADFFAEAGPYDGNRVPQHQFSLSYSPDAAPKVSCENDVLPQGVFLAETGRAQVAERYKATG